MLTCLTLWPKGEGILEVWYGYIIPTVVMFNISLNIPLIYFWEKITQTKFIVCMT